MQESSKTKASASVKLINVEEIILPNVPLNNFQLIKAAKKLKLKHFRGVFVRDQLPKKHKKKNAVS